MQKLRSKRGVTIIELVMAVLITSILLAIVFSTWNYITLHVTSQKRIGALHQENRRIMQTITGKLRHSPVVIQCESQSISFVNPDSTDTLKYTFDGTALKVNDSTIVLIIPNTTIASFSLQTSVDKKLSASSTMLIDLSIGLKNSSGDSCSIKETISARRSDGLARQESKMWNW